MTITGYTSTRADPHDRFASEVFAELERRGYNPKWLEVKGNEPDIGIDDLTKNYALVDAKTRMNGNEKYAIKIGSLEAYQRRTVQKGPRVYIIWRTGPTPQEWFVDTADTLIARIHGGPLRPTKNGSLTDWILVRRGGTRFDKFFPPRR